MTTLAQIQAAGAAGRLLPATVENLTLWFAAGLPAWAVASVDELVAAGAWAELNDRFYRQLEFGTGGMRGRTIGAIVTAAERGDDPARWAPRSTPRPAAMCSTISRCCGPPSGCSNTPRVSSGPRAARNRRGW